MQGTKVCGLWMLAIVALAGVAAAVGATEPTVEELVAGADRTRLGWDAYVVDVTITNFKADEVDDVSRYQVSFKGSDRSLVRFEDPRDQGKYLLNLEESMWLYLPTASRPIRVTALQRLSGNASNGDIAQASLVTGYESTLVGEEEIADRAAYVLDLTAKSKMGSYRHIRLWIDKETRLAIRAEYRLASGKVSKVALFDRYEMVDGRHLLRRQVILDMLRNEQRTVLDYDGYKPQDLPDKLFNKNYLGQL